MRPLLFFTLFLFYGCGGAEGSDDAGVDAGTIDAGRADGVHCSGATADCVLGEICCGGALDTVCQAPGVACDGQSFACDGIEDCPGELCCSDGSGSACAGECAGLRLCHSELGCEAGESCCPNGGGQPGGAMSHCTTLAAGESCPLPP